MKTGAGYGVGVMQRRRYLSLLVRRDDGSYVPGKALVSGFSHRGLGERIGEVANEMDSPADKGKAGRHLFVTLTNACFSFVACH